MGEDGQRVTAVEDLQPLAAGRRFGDRYRLERRIGSGGMATVWLAVDERLGRQVAIKFLADGDDDEFVRRFCREAKLAARLHHPNLVSIFDFAAGPQPYLVMEYIDGGTIADRLAAGDPPNPELLAEQLLTALSAIHANEILHRDVKPGNVLFDSGGNARLVDFGIALAANTTSLTRTGLVVGTETYMAPEVRAGEPASERSDLYALGVMLAEVAEAAGASGATWALIERLRSRDPADRPRSATAALAQFEREVRSEPRPEPTARMAIADAVADPTPTPAGGAPLPPPPSETRRGHPGRAIGLAAIVLVLAALVAGLTLGGGDDDEQGGSGGKRAAAEDPKPAEQRTPATPEGSANTPADGVSLNDQGFALINAERYEEAIPVLERAVQLLEGSGDELTYNYALYNLAHALRLAGRPEEAIPLLEQRLEYPDQQETVAAELDAALADAGIEEGD